MVWGLGAKVFSLGFQVSAVVNLHLFTTSLLAIFAVWLLKFC